MFSCSSRSVFFKLQYQTRSPNGDKSGNQTGPPYFLLSLKYQFREVCLGIKFTSQEMYLLYVHQLQWQDKDFEKATFYFQHMRLKEKERRDLKYSIRNKELAVENIDLLHDTRLEKNMTWKLFFK